jgi:Rrf2 family protein
VRLSKSAQYALLAVIELARSPEPVTVAQVAAREHLPEGALAKVFQALVRARIVQGTRGVHGGYRLCRAPSELSVLAVVELFGRAAARALRLRPEPLAPAGAARRSRRAHPLDARFRHARTLTR